ncbi:hypothetical protein M405DRAFT_811576, partial [Rhizopogon salebrosus TDB-379]
FFTPIKIGKLFRRGVIVFTTCVNNTIGRAKSNVVHTYNAPSSFDFSYDTMNSNMLSGIRDSRFLQVTKTIRIKAVYASHLLRHNTILRDIDVK